MSSTPDSWPAEVVASWVASSCAAQGVPVQVSDPATVRNVLALLGGPVAAEGRGQRGPAAAGTPGPDRRRFGRLEKPDRLDSGGIEALRAGGAWSDHRMVQHRRDDRRLAGQVQPVPRSA